MTRQEATDYCRSRLTEFNLTDWKIKLVSYESGKQVFLGKCDSKLKIIYLNTFHIDTHPEIEVRDTINHEIAHALTPYHGHDVIWRNKAIELGSSGQACVTYILDPRAIDAIRSGDILEVDYVEVKRKVLVEEEQIVREPKYKVTRYQDKCDVCGKVAKEKSTKEFRSQGILKKLITLECGHVRIINHDSQSPFDLIVSNFWKEHVVNCKHEFDKNKCTKCDEFRLFPFQVEGARFLEKSNGRAAVFDQQGLGKTVQALAYIKFHPEVLPVLFIVKSKLKFQWQKEIIRWLGEKYFAQVISDSKQGFMPGMKCYITSFDLLRRIPKAKFEALGIKCAVIDEVQSIKNPDSTRTQEVRKVLSKVPHIIPLSGTPWKNRGSEFFVVLNMLNPQKFYSYQHFLNTWVDYYMHGNVSKMGGIRNIPAFREAIKDIAIRRERNDVMPDLPTVNRMKLTVEIEDSSRKAYDDEVSEFVKWYNELVISGEEDSGKTEGEAIARLQRMRHILGLAKIPSTVEFVEEFLDECDRHLVIGVHHKDVGIILTQQLKNLNQVEVLALTAGLTDEENQRIKDRFINLPRAILVASTLSAGEGTDGLQKVCSDMIIHERQWNPMNEEQLEDRLIRIGQDSNSVNCTYVHAENTTDTHLDGIVETKRRQFHAVMNKGEIPKWNQSSIISELIEALVRGKK
jgi:hypothetical protein